MREFNILEIANDVVIGSAAWLRMNQKCKLRPFYMGKPAFERPIEFISEDAKAKDKYID